MNSISRIISGGVCLLLGILLGYNSFIAKEGFWGLFSFGLILMILGIFILFNNKEDEIEQIHTQVLKSKTYSNNKGKRR